MNKEGAQLAAKLIGASYVSHSMQAIKRAESLVNNLLMHHHMPQEGWSDNLIEWFLAHLSQMDTNNYVDNVGVGEREGRVFSSIVRQRHFGLAHGVGRSGDITAMQPKAAGSSLLYTLTNYMALDALRLAGAPRLKRALVLPTATGMALVLALQTLRQKAERHAPDKEPPQYVVWSRIDQKTCLKCIPTAGFTPIVVELKREGTTLSTDLGALRAAIERVGADKVLCVLSTTSCFAPRNPDDVLNIARLCQELGVPHIVNNAYGVQSASIMKGVNSALTHGRVDCVIQSTDKNFMVPVGGAVVASADDSFVTSLSALYPGRASASPILDLFVTLLGMGRRTFLQLLEARRTHLPYFLDRLRTFASERNESVLTDDRNDVSFALTLDTLPADRATQLGSSLFYKCVSGPRVVPKGASKDVCGLNFTGYGAHCDQFPHSYLTAACAIGIEREDVDGFMKRLEKAWKAALKPPKEKEGAAGDEEEEATENEELEEEGEKGEGSGTPECTENRADKTVHEAWQVVGSTMDVVREATQRHPWADFVLVTAEQQSKGRGTHGRVWLSPLGNVSMTIAIRKTAFPDKREFTLPLETGVIVIDAIRGLCPGVEGLSVKWPNDVLGHAKKLSGCLIEDYESYRLIGIGINVATAPQVVDGGRVGGCLSDMGMDVALMPLLRTAIFDGFHRRLKETVTREEIVEQWRRLADFSIPLFKRDEERTEVMAQSIDDWGQLTVKHVRGGTIEVLTAEYLW